MRYSLKKGSLHVKREVKANTVDSNDYRTWPPKLMKVWVFREGEVPGVYEGVCSSMMVEEMEARHGCGWVPYLDCWEPDWAPEDSDDE